MNRMTRAYTKTKAGEEYSVSYTYDALGRVVSTTDEMGNTTKVSYDKAGNVISATDAEGVVTQTATYDKMGRTTKVTDALGVETRYQYDAMGNVLSVVEVLNSGNRTTSYTYDKLGRLTSVTDPMSGVTKATYDKQGNIASITDANGGVTKYTYDSMGQLIAEISPLGNQSTYTYNAGGLLAESKNARGQATTYTYDAVGRITSMTDELGTVHYTYDPNGNVLTTTDSQGTISRKYDALNRVTEYTDYKGNTVKYGYDEIGNLISLTYPGGEIVRYSYYKNGWLHTVTDAKGNVTKYSYDARGNLTRTERPNGTEEICTYDATGLLIAQKDIKGEEVLTDYTYTYDDSGNITAIDGTETTDTEEGISRLNSAKMTYDAENRLITYNGETLRYDADGNMTYGPVNGVMSELVYDCRNRLVSAGGIRYTYDAENNRTSMETDSYREEYVTDTVSSSLSRVLTTTRYEKSSTSEAKGQTTLCIYGSGLIYECTGDIYLYHHYNHLGSTMKLTDVKGTVMASYTYGVYGELLSGDTGLTSFLYNGRMGVSTDDNGLYYMRQRYYNPEIKRFVNQDILTGSMDNSQSLNRYCYVQGNPVSYVDPFGLSPLAALQQAGQVALGATHVILGGLSIIPTPVGIVAGAIDTLLYAFVDHDFYGALTSGLGTVGMGFGNIAGMAMGGSKLSVSAAVAEVLCDVAGGVVSFNDPRNAGDNNTLETFGTVALVAVLGTVGATVGSKMFGKNAGRAIDNVMDEVVEHSDDAGRVFSKVDDVAVDVARASNNVNAGRVDDVVEAITPNNANATRLDFGGCFVAGTQVKVSGGSKSIEDVQVGDYVYAKNTETGECGWKRVVRVFVHQKTELIHIQLGEERIDTTTEHPFWVDGYGFKAAEDLLPGEYVETADGELLQVISVEKEYLDEPVTVYNFEVEDWHTYYVSEEEVLVHNMCAMVSEGGSDVINKLDDVLSSKTLTNQTKKVDNYVSSIKGNAAAKADFDAMNPTNIRTYANGTIAGDLPDGRTINIHPSTTLGGTPSVEIYDPVTGKSIKIRY